MTNKTASPTIVAPGGTVTYTITYSNPGGIDLSNVVITEQYPPQVTFISASQPPDSGTNNRWTIGTLSAGESGKIAITIQVPEAINISYSGEGSARGTGFVNSYQKLDTGQESYTLTNTATISSKELGPVASSASVTVAEVRGTSLTQMEHGSGTYRNEQLTKMLTKNRSIEVNSSLSARYRPTSFSLPQGRSIKYSSRWSDVSQAKNRETGASINEEYRYATRIDRNSYMKLDENESKLITDTNFEGAGHIGIFKKSDPNATAKTNPVFESSEDYIGSFHVYENAEEYGQNVQSDRSASGTGAVSVDKRVRASQRTYEYGTGSYKSDEQIRTPESYIAKDLNVTHGSMSYKLTPNSTWINASSKWTEGIWSRTQNTSFLGEEISSADYIKAESAAKGLNDLDSKTNYSGRGTFRAVLKDKIDLAEDYTGKYSLVRKVHLTGVSRYDQPHLTLTKTGQMVHDTNIARYLITVLNDGNSALEPVYVKDLFPLGTVFINASVEPFELTGTYANWTFLYLSIGQSVNIDLRLNVTDERVDLINTVQSIGSYDGKWVTANNYSAIQVNWLPCYNPQISATKTAKIEEPNIVRYRLAIKNQAKSPMVAKVIDYLPGDMRFLNASIAPAERRTDNVSWVLTDIAPGETRTIEYRVETLRNGRFMNNAHVDAYFVDGSGTASTDTSAYVIVGGASVGTANSGWQPPDWDLDLSENICGADNGTGPGCTSCPTCA